MSEQPSLEVVPIDPHERKKQGGPNWARLLSTGGLALGLVILTSGATYAAVANNWVPGLIGTFYTEADVDAKVSLAEERSRAAGYEEGLSSGIAEGEAVGYSQGEADGYDSGHADGFAEGRDVGYDTGYDDGYADGGLQAWDEGYTAGSADGYDAGWGDGYNTGWYDGCIALFNGLGTDRVGDWWDYYYSPAYASYYTATAC